VARTVAAASAAVGVEALERWLGKLEHVAGASRTGVFDGFNRAIAASAIAQ
jgi:hypothetical protein